MKYLTLISCLLLAGCADAEGDSYRILERDGYTNIRILGRGFFGCGRDDGYVVKFKATNLNNREVEGVVCGGVFTKAYTIRTY